MLEAILHNPFLQSALVAGLLASVASGMVGSYMVVKRITFISGSIAHSVLSGMGLFLWLNRSKGLSYLDPLHGALLSALCSALFMGWIHLNYREREDTAIAVIWSLGMAVGVLFTSLTPGFNVELTSFLIGNILWVSSKNLYTLFALDLVLFFVVLLKHKSFLAICFDEQQARLQGLSVNSLYMTLLILIAISVVILIQVVGIFLVIALLTIPATIANHFSIRLSKVMVGAVLISTFFCLSGTLLSFQLNWPAGATIAIVAGLSYGIALLAPGFYAKRFQAR
jgi:zinc transport system permease protein